MFGFRKRAQGIAPAGPDGTVKAEMYPPAGDQATHVGPKPFDQARSKQMRAFEDLDQPPQGPVYVDPRHNLYMPSRYAMGWFGGLIPNQPLPDWSILAQSNTQAHHAPLTQAQAQAKISAAEKRRGTQFPTAVVNPPIYLRHGGAAPIGIGPMQIQSFHVATDAMHPDVGNGPGSTYANAPFMAAGFGAET